MPDMQSEDKEIIMIWNKVKDFPPIEGKNVIVFRGKKRRYTIAKLEKAPSKKDVWRTSFGNALRLDDCDYWKYFSPLILTEVFE